ncbi:TatD family hydrolase [Bifidobacterium gallicum]|uniref:Hydrolase, TatD family n=1 Tax=Bifidobacterium gallicum DSM 20093 = LMG 11596 TaxID=561180 RepID=D1NVQ9_9BIFI|nr:TatD family hydrolase [Bifidobacterium gallicum]EFA22910.1 hydrolase, TatD family [Bifidobacterium gallicum DSM 20093 = LMG 11596]KFI59391.1 TatD family hydrolase [Bifidobacterium gallicum DSM 20093 = LMG 11596]
MSKKHRDRSWAPAPVSLPADAQVIDNHTHVASVVPFSETMNHEAVSKGQPQVPVYSVRELLDQAAAVGVEGVIDCGCELPHLMTAVDMAIEHPDRVHAAIAIHPNESVLHGHRGVPGPDGLPVRYKPWHDVPFDEAMAEVARIARAHPRQVVAIGETGMDLFRTGESAKELQRQAFRDHIALAKELGLALQIHDRDAHREVIDTLLADGAPERTVFHSYSGDTDMAQIAKEHGWYLSMSGASSYKGNESIRESARIVGLDHVMVETDAPYLTPMPYRGRTNAPYMIPYTLQALADHLDMPLVDVARATRETTKRVYGV